MSGERGAASRFLSSSLLPASFHCSLCFCFSFPSFLPFPSFLSCTWQWRYLTFFLTKKICEYGRPINTVSFIIKKHLYIHLRHLRSFECRYIACFVDIQLEFAAFLVKNDQINLLSRFSRNCSVDEIFQFLQIIF